MRKILGVNISHNCSFAYFEDNILKEYYEEDRFNKIKNYLPDQDELANYTYEYKTLKKFNNITFDAVVFASFDRGHLQIELPIIKHILKQVQYKKYFFDITNHHIYHALCGFYFSKFDNAIALISDGGGETEITPYMRTLQSIFLVNKKQIITKYKYVSSNAADYHKSFVPTETTLRKNNIDFTITNQPRVGLRYVEYLLSAGFKLREEGQLMGIAAYKDKENNLNNDVLEIANKAQEETLQEVKELIDQSKKYSDCKNIILSGGYHLNCSNNFKLVKQFPEYNFFVDPIPYDAGTAIGAVSYYEDYL